MTEESSNIKKYKTKNPLKKFFISRFKRKIINTLQDIETQNILDIGCGEGFIIKEISETYPKLTIEGTDISNESLEKAKKLNPNIKFSQANIYNLPFKENQFDLCLCLEVLEHLRTPEKATIEIKKLSSKYFIFSVPCEPLFSISNMLFGKNVSRLGKDPEHLQYWSKKKFKKFISKDYNIKQTFFSFPWTIILAKK